MSAAESARPHERRCASRSRRSRSQIDRAYDDRMPSTGFECVVRRSFVLLLIEDRRDHDRELARIDFVETSENNVRLNVDHWIAAKHTIEHCFFDPLLHRRDVLARNNAADDFVFDDQSFAALAWP